MPVHIQNCEDRARVVEERKNDLGHKHCLESRKNGGKKSKQGPCRVGRTLDTEIGVCRLWYRLMTPAFLRLKEQVL